MPEHIWVMVEADATGESAREAAERAIDRLRAEGVHGPQVDVKTSFDPELCLWSATATGAFSVEVPGA